MDVGDWTLLQVAAQTNENHVVNLLLNSGADSNIPIENTDDLGYRVNIGSPGRLIA